MVISIDEDSDIFENSKPIAIPNFSVEGKRDKIPPFKKQIDISNIKCDLYNKRTNYRSCCKSRNMKHRSPYCNGCGTTYSSVSSSSEGSTGMINSYCCSSCSISMTEDHPLSDSLDDENQLGCKYGVAYWDEFDQSDDESISSTSTESSNSSYSTSLNSSLRSIPRKSSSYGNVLNVNVEIAPNSLGESFIESSTESLTKLLNDKSSEPQPELKRANVVSNIKISFQKLKDTIQNSSMVILGAYSQDPRLTDDTLPHRKIEKPISFQELSTFHSSSVSEETSEIQPSSKTFRNREQRVNSEFLRLYALDYKARLDKILPCEYSSEEFANIFQANPQLKRFHMENDLFKISKASRDKLWKSVILPPRVDAAPSNIIDCTQYIHIGSSSTSNTNYSSLTTSNGRYLPWDSGRLSLKPAGKLHNLKTMENSKCPSSGLTNAQFTIKGWCNQRWIDCSQD